MLLDALLAELGEAARSADFARLNAISAMLETVPIPTDRAVLLRSARLSGENRVLLDAAAKGLRAAHRRLNEVSDGQRLQTYDGAGRKNDHTAPAGLSARL